jgi:signal transduction histidine kinase
MVENLSFAMTPFGLAGLLAGISSFVFGAFVYWKTPNKKIGLSWFVFSLSVSIWCLGTFWVTLVPDAEQALLVWRLSFCFGANWIPVLFFDFVTRFTQIPMRRALVVQWVVSGMVFVLSWTPMHYGGVSWFADSFYYVTRGTLYELISLWWIGLVVYSHSAMVRHYSEMSDKRKIQVRYFFLATVVGFGGGFFDYLPAINLHLYPWGRFAIILYPIIMSYAILKYRLMDIRFFIRRTFLWIAVYAGLLISSAPILLLIHQQAVTPAGVSAFLLGVEVVLLAIVLSLGPVLYAAVVRQSAYFHEHTMAGLTHELKSPLSAIEGALDVLIYEAQKKADDPKQKEYLDMIDRNSSRLRGFVDELLLVMKSGAKTSQLNFEPVNMGELCREVVSTFEEAAHTKGNKLVFQGEINFLINADSAKIKKVMSNLLSNAIKFTKNGAITVSLIQEKEHVKVQVADTGVGLAAGDIPYVFDTFYQTSAGQKAKGTGIGLAIAKLWVEAHGGVIGAESDGEGKGSLFWFKLPR